MESRERTHAEDAEVLPQQTVPPPQANRDNDVWAVGKLTFRADFDSANLASVEQGPAANEFLLYTRRDGQNGSNPQATRTWFYFGVSGHSVADLVVMTIMNLNKQGRLYSQDYRPVWWSPSQSEWQPIRLKTTYRREGEDGQLRFVHRFENDEETFFAFAIPFSYQQTQDMLDRLDEQLRACSTVVPRPAPAAESPQSTSESASTPSLLLSPSSRVWGAAPPPGGAANGAAHAAALRASPPASTSGRRSSHDGNSAALYYRRQLLSQSLEGRRVDLITITDCSGATGEKEGHCEGAFEHDPGPPADVFRDKKVFFVSSRVHPGETPATHMFNGMLALLLRRTDARAVALRRRFVFKLVPLVNPDGVAHGNYRTDSLGQNLNRFYSGVPDKELQPSVYAIKSLLMYYAKRGQLEYYIDLHAHANKKGAFIYGNTLEDGDAHLQSLLYSKLVALNNPSFDFVGCNFTEKNMSRADKDGASKEGAGRVALYRETGLTHLYTIEANYNSARQLNVIAPASGEHAGRASPPCNKRFPPRFTALSLQGVGRAVLVAALDMDGANPWSRLPNCEHRSLDGVRNWILSVMRAGPETRAAHLPPMSDAAVEAIRGKIVTGALRVSSTGVNGARRRSLGVQGDGAAAVGFSSTGSGPVAFGRSVQNPAPVPAFGRRPLAPAFTPQSRPGASLPVVGAGAGAGAATHSFLRRAAVSSVTETSSSLARSASLPSHSAPVTARRVTGLGKEPDADLADSFGEAAGLGSQAGEDGPSDSDGDSSSGSPPPPPKPAPPAPRPGSARFRGVESPGRHFITRSAVPSTLFDMPLGVRGNAVPPSTGMSSSGRPLSAGALVRPGGVGAAGTTAAEPGRIFRGPPRAAADGAAAGPPPWGSSATRAPSAGRSRPKR